MTTQAKEVFEALAYTIKVDRLGNKRYYNAAGQLHREDGPAIEYVDGSKTWLQNDIVHREDGPALEYKSGVKIWQNNGEIHRIGGPAVVFRDGTELWYLHGTQCTEENYYSQLKLLKGGI